MDDLEMEMERERARARAKAASATPAPGIFQQIGMPSALDTVNDSVTGIGQGLTLSFGDELNAAAAAPLRVAKNAIMGGDEGKSVLDRFVGAYNRGLEKQRAIVGGAQERSPVAEGVGEVAGGVLPFILSDGATGSVAAPATGNAIARTVAATKGVAKRALRAGAEGSLYGGAYGFGTGEGAADRTSRGIAGGLLGFGLGAASAPIIEGGAALGERVLAPAYRSVFRHEGEAARRAGTMLERDRASVSPSAPIVRRGLNDQEFAAAKSEGLPVTNLDRGAEATTGLADASYANSGEARNILNETLNNRSGQQLKHYTDLIDAMTPGGGSVTARDAIRATASKANNAAYTLANMHPNAQQMWNEGFEQLMQSDLMQKAAKGALSTGTNEAAVRGFNPIQHPFAVKKMEDGTERLIWRPDMKDVQPNLAFWDQVKKNLDSIIQGGTDITGKKSYEAVQAGDLKRKLVDHLDQMVPAYKTARQGAGKYLGLESAGDLGGQLYNKSGSYTLADVKKQIGRWTPAEREEAATAYLDALRNDLHEKAKAPDAGQRDLSKNFLSSQKDRDFAEIILGPQRFKALVQRNSVLRLMAARRDAIQGNSRTVQRLAGQAALGVSGGALANYELGGGPLEGAGLGAAAMFGGRAVKHMLTDRMAVEIARRLSSNDPTLLAQGQQLLQQNPAIRRTVKALLSAMTVGGSQGGVSSFSH